MARRSLGGLGASLLSLIVLGLAPGCGNPAPASDGGLDANERDAFAGDAAECPLDCTTPLACCYDAEGVPHCVDLSSDILNCGVCNRDCVAQRRGDSCSHFSCACGDFEIGCTGMENSVCCPGIGGTRPYCANPGTSFLDCGGCGRVCDSARASRCSGGNCLCGDRSACTGEANSRCCADLAGASSCVDTTSDQAHCGQCGRRCTALEHCVSGSCEPTVFGDAGT